MTLKPSAGDGSALEWIKSSHSTNDGPDCVEVATTPGTVHVRDSKDAQGPRLAFAPGAWTDFVTYTAGR
jgi:hypothetical protein